MKLKTITRTAILLAIVIAFQMLGTYLGPYNNFIVGSVVNAVLLIATAIVGLWSGVAIAVIAPFVSALTNKAAIAPIILAFSPFIVGGNLVLIISFYLLRTKNQIAGVATGAVLKFGFLFAAVTIFAHFVKVPPILLTLFSFPQLITAVIGGVIALAIVKPLKKALPEY